MELAPNIERKVVDIAIEKGIDHLWSLHEQGCWRGFPTLAGTSDIWVTGFMLAHIAHLGNRTGAIRASQDFLIKSRQASGGWSYCAQVPSDADSTAWCLMALQSSHEITGEILEKALVFLWKHYNGQGVATYTADSGIREFISAPSTSFLTGWLSPHPDVSIATALADLGNEKVPEILSWLLDQKNNFGLIDSYWWRGPYYTTTLLLRALSKNEKRLTGSQSKYIAEGLVGKQLMDGGFGLDSSAAMDVFSTALALESFVHLPNQGLEGARDRCGKALLESQRSNGGWDGGFILRIPAPNVVDPSQVASWNGAQGGGNSYVADNDGLFATALACYALDCWRHESSEPKTSLL